MRSPAATFDLRAALSDEITSALSELTAAPHSPKALHRCRVHLKRARALARVGRACAPGLASVFNDTARSVMHALAQARDLTALANTARELAKDAGKKRSQALNTVADNLEAARAALPPLNIESARTGLRDLLALAQVWPEASPRQIERGAARIALRARRACARGRNADTPPRRHEWRKREKDRFYAATMLGKAWPEDFPARRKRGEALGHVLGMERDVLLLIQRLETEPGLAGTIRQAERALNVLRGRRDRLAPRADKMGARMHRNGA
ncbi:MAG TPA: CHAD domain-containing protein [Caulobacterales bacterium]|nr:CHAD domain-containing protein [Caulobacterales bacterium]